MNGTRKKGYRLLALTLCLMLSAVCAAFVIGDHLAFAAANAPEAIAPMMAAKLISGVVAVLIALLFFRPGATAEEEAAEGEGSEAQ